MPALQKRFLTWAIALAGLSVAFLLPANHAIADDAEPQLIINAGVSAPDNLTPNTLRAIFSGRMQTWPDGTQVKVFVLPESHPLHKKFCLTYLRTFPYVLQNHWDQLTFTGAGVAPTEVATTYQLHQKVRATPGAIGYANRLPGNKDAVKLLSIRTNTRPEGTPRL